MLNEGYRLMRSIKPGIVDTSPPLLAAPTSPPRGGRLAIGSVPQGKRTISPLEGEMSRSNRGGEASAKCQSSEQTRCNTAFSPASAMDAFL